MKFNNLIAKLRILGNIVIELDNGDILVKDTLNGKSRIIARDGRNTVSSIYDTIYHLDKSDYNIVENKGLYGVIYKSYDKDVELAYSKMSSYVEVEDGKYNITSRLGNSFYGVIDCENNIKIPFIHSSIKAYKTSKDIIYVGNILDTLVLYNKDGDRFDINRLIGVCNVIVCEQFVILFIKDKYIVSDLYGSIIEETEGTFKYNGSNYSLLDKNDKVIIDDIQVSKEIK